MKYITASQAKRALSRLLDEAAVGEEIIITCRGRAVAKLGPAQRHRVDADRKSAVDRLLALLDLPLGNVRFRRDELYHR